MQAESDKKKLGNLVSLIKASLEDDKQANISESSHEGVKITSSSASDRPIVGGLEKFAGKLPLPRLAWWMYSAPAVGSAYWHSTKRCSENPSVEIASNSGRGGT